MGPGAEVLDLQVRSGLWVPHPQDATVPRGLVALWDSSVTRASPTALFSQDAAPGVALVVLPSGLEPCALWPGSVRPAPRLSMPLWRGRAGMTVKCPHREDFCKRQHPRPWSWPGAPSPSSSHVGAPPMGNSPNHPATGAWLWPLQELRNAALEI